jgi:hypothetical protein
MERCEHCGMNEHSVIIQYEYLKRSADKMGIVLSHVDTNFCLSWGERNEGGMKVTGTYTFNSLSEGEQILRAIDVDRQTRK